jgi:hypothetical protein
MGKHTVFYLTGLLLPASLAACALGATNPPVPAASPALDSPTFPSETQIPVTIPNSEPTPTSTVIPVATSRGAELAATDPDTVTLDSGGLQLLEFFRFT